MQTWIKEEKLWEKIRKKILGGVGKKNQQSGRIYNIYPWSVENINNSVAIFLTDLHLLASIYQDLNKLKYTKCTILIFYNLFQSYFYARNIWEFFKYWLIQIQCKGIYTESYTLKTI